MTGRSTILARFPWEKLYVGTVLEADAARKPERIKQRLFNGEFAIHFRGLEGLDKPVVWVFPEIIVCLHCGLTEFIVPERELQVLVQGVPVKGAVVLDKKVDSQSRMAKFPSPEVDG